MHRYIALVAVCFSACIGRILDEPFTGGNRDYDPTPTNDTSGTPTEDGSPGSTNPSEPTACETVREADARVVFETYCSGCHGTGPRIEGGFRDITNLQSLIDREYVVPFESGSSLPYNRIVRREMPPVGAPRPGQKDIDTLKTWIDCGARLDEMGSSPRAEISMASRIALMQADVEQRNFEARQNTRYLVLTHLFNAGLDEATLDSYREGLSFALNSLSSNPEIVRPEPIDADRTVYRIDLRDYGWNRSTWSIIEQGYPYGISFSRSSSAFGYDSGDAFELRSATETGIPYVYADWFLGQATRPPLYYEILELGSTLPELTDQLQVPFAENIEDGSAVRAGFAESGVSFNNRVIERHALPGRGAFWISYDFRTSVGEQNIFSNPLDFQQDGGELIFNLPNGLQAYFLINSAGTRLDAAPQDIVADPSRPARGIESGVSCMGCHDAQGIIPKADEVRDFAMSQFDRSDFRDRVLELYALPGVLEAFRTDDGERFRAARAEAGVQEDRRRPVSTALADYESRVDVVRVAATLGVSKDELMQALTSDPGIRVNMASLASPGAVLRREVFEQDFADTVCELGLGRPMRCGDPVEACSCF